MFYLTMTNYNYGSYSKQVDNNICDVADEIYDRDLLFESCWLVIFEIIFIVNYLHENHSCK